MRTLKPVCNGCNLSIPDMGKVHGDLWANAGGDLFVFVPVLKFLGPKYPSPVPAWNASNTNGPHLVIVRRDTDYWERQNIFILPRQAVDLSQELEEYLQRWEY